MIAGTVGTAGLRTTGTGVVGTGALEFLDGRRGLRRRLGFFLGIGVDRRGHGREGFGRRADFAGAGLAACLGATFFTIWSISSSMPPSTGLAVPAVAASSS